MKILITEYLSYCKEQLGLNEHSLRAYAQDLRAFGAYAALRQVTSLPKKTDIISYQKHLREEREASPATIRRRMVTLKSYFRWLEETDASVTSPFRDLRLELKIPKTLPRPVDRPTLAQLFRATPSTLDSCPMDRIAYEQRFSSEQVTGLVVRLLVVTGLRVGEITSLDVGDVSGAASRIRVRGKGNRERTVYVTNDKLLLDFQTYWDWRYRVAGAASCLFINSLGRRLTAPAFRKRLRTVSKKLVVEPHLTPHRFRHSAATLLIEEGVDIRLVQRLLGHASIATTELYTKVSDNSLVAAIERADTLSQVDH
ncbi:MAG: tyrosine-type recombinase/integrase [Phyllobacteriaceae bacterium]|nr:tyrosine-type recombinase/integrase [Phyllobacteriaceae bacterium]